MKSLTDLDYDVDQGIEEGSKEEEQEEEDSSQESIGDAEEGFVHWLDVPKEGVSNWTDSSPSPNLFRSNAEPRLLGLFGDNYERKRRRQVLKVKRKKAIDPVEAVPTVARPEPGFDHPQILIRPKTLRTDVRPSRVRLFYETVDKPGVNVIKLFSIVADDEAL
jgi:hypothetical protein